MQNYNYTYTPGVSINGSIVLNEVVSTIPATPTASQLPNALAVQAGILANNTNVVTPAITAAIAPLTADIAALETAVAAVVANDTAYTRDVTSVDWTGGGASPYTITVTGVTHGQGTWGRAAQIAPGGEEVYMDHYYSTDGNDITFSCYGGMAAGSLAMKLVIR